MSTVRSIRGVGLPAPAEALVLKNGSMNPVWYAWFNNAQHIISSQSLSQIARIDTSTLPHGTAIKWNATNKRWEAF